MSADRYLLPVAVILAIGFTIRGLIGERREYRALSQKVRLALPSQRCRRCGGEFKPWRGTWGRVNACIEYVLPREGEEFIFWKHEFSLKCQSCQKWTVFWVRSDGALVSRNEKLGLDPDL